MKTFRQGQVARWSRSRDVDHGLEHVRDLSSRDTEEYRELLELAPVSSAFHGELLERVGSPVPDIRNVRNVGYFNSVGRLEAACWVGGNVIPTPSSTRAAEQIGDYVARTAGRVGSIFGDYASVHTINAQFERYGRWAKNVRRSQPLLELRALSPGEVASNVVVAEPSEIDQVLPAATAMFEEEVGFRPLSGPGSGYRSKVASLLDGGRTLVGRDPRGAISFKADFGVVSTHTIQIQGVWLRPDLRGKGLSAPYMRAVAAKALALRPSVSLYVNDFNARARALYSRVGFTEVGRYATVMF